MTTQERQALLARKARIVRRLSYALAAFLAVAVGLTLVVLLIQNQRLDQQSRILIECTTPPGARTPPEDHPLPNDCFVRSQKSTASILMNVNRVSVAAAACGADHPGDVDATEECVKVAIKEMAEEAASGK
jgi:hypothetical protein